MTTTTAAYASSGDASRQPVPGPAALLAHQLRFEARAARRSPVLIGFTVAMPLALLGIFGTLLAEETVGPFGLAYRAYLVPNVVVIGLLSTCFASLGMTLAVRRGTGELKRLRGTPVAPGIVLAALAVRAAVLGAAVALALVACGRWWWGLPLPAAGPFAVLLAVSALGLSALGVAVATFVHRPENGPPVTNMLLWPVAFVSGTFTWVPSGSVLDRLALVLPVRHLNRAALAAMDASGPSIAWRSLGAVAAWGLLGAVVARARFRWEPSR